MTKCKLWKGAKCGGTGYGNRKFRGRYMGAHRAAWIEAYGPIPEGLCVLHRCDTKLCVRPDHLFLGTQKDNIHDCISKGRYKKSRLTSEQLRAVLSAKWGEVTKAAVSVGITQQYASRLRGGRKCTTCA